MVEQITEELKKAAEEAKKICEASLLQEALQAAAEAAKKAKEQIDKALLQLAKIPDEAIDSLQKAILKLMTIINGWEDTSSPEFDPQKIIDAITSLLDPVIAALNALPVPSIPGLFDIAALLAKLSSMKLSSSPKPGKMPDMPPELLLTLQDLLIAVMSLAATLPTVLISLVFDMLNNIISMFTDIAGVIGVPSIPSPLSLVPLVISAMPDILKAVGLLPGKMGVAVTGTIKKQLKGIMDMQIPDAPNSIDVPKTLPPCPAKDVAK